MFPFDHVAIVEMAEPSGLFRIQLSEFQAHVEVRSAREDDWVLREVRVERNDGQWVREPIFERMCRDAACGSSGMAAIQASVDSEIAERRNGGMHWAARSDAGDVRVREVAA